MLRKSSQSQSAGKRSQHARSMPLALCTLLMCASFDNTWTAWRLIREEEDVEYQPTDSDEYEPFEDTVDDLD